MIKGKLDMLKTGSIGNPKIAHALNILRDIDFSEIEGKKKISNDMHMLVFEYITEPDSERSAEAHRKEIDVHYIIAGKEKIGVGKPSKDNIVIQDYDEEKDAELYSEVKNETFIEMTTGMFAVFFPEDIHRPGCILEESSTIKKVVIKIKI